ncbi:TerB N-terminal domain-containing protein [Variovorax ureilyticus]|uniref:TerB N-terminal domain-containing protein n=1 Tax=Variovorax ureilyticus TaxID=1836198 RepID=A0ABU8VLR4_9BURK
MAGRKKPSSSSTGALIFGGIVLMLALVPLKAWLAIGFLALVGIGFFVYQRNRPTNSAPERPGLRDLEPLEFTATSQTAPSGPTRSEFPRGASFVQPVEDELVEVVAPRHTFDARIPAAPKSYGPGTWIPAGTPCVVGSLTIPGGMVYVGTSLRASSGAVDPCLINPSLSIAKRGNYTTRDMGYWPSYSDISPNARRSYLEWLADGRKDPEADIGYVFLFFYGLERRAILDARLDAAAQEEWPVIAQELRRLLDVYGEKSHSFKRYASELLNWMAASNYPADLYNHLLPDLPKGLELPVYVRLALGRAAVDDAPVPAHLALGWAKLDPSTYLRTAAERCAPEFDRLFTQKYAEQYGAGIILPRNRTKLHLVYQAASAGFRGMDVKLSFGDTPDVTALTGPIQKVRALVEETTAALDSYSRFVGRNPNARSALEGLLHLPATLWPQSAQDVLSELKQRMGDGMLAMSFQELLSKLDAQSKLTKEKTHALARALESLNIGIEPDVLAGAKLPKPDEKVVLFAVPPGEPVSRATPAYQAAALTLQLASAVATVDGDFSAREMSHLRQQVLSWTHLTPNHIRRLLAHLRLLMVTPASLPALKKKLEPLDAHAKEVLATFMATVAQSDGEIAPAEVRMLESIYKALGVDSKKVFSDVHAVAANAPSPTTPSGFAQPVPPSTPATAPAKAAGFKLDAARIAELQRESQEVSALLANIFVDEEAAAPSVPVTEQAPALAEPSGVAGLMGLDEAHSALARLLLQRPTWPRSDLADAAADLELMLEGALLSINEAAFDAYDISFTEGDDPIEVNTEILEKLEA